MTWFGPTDEWPQHPQQWWRDALRAARAAGWHLVTFGGKNWGRVCCSRDEGACSVLIFTTGRGSESVARDLPKRIRRCRHVGGAVVPGARLRYAEERILDAERLLDTVERLVVARLNIARAHELFDSIDTAMDDAGALVARALAMEAEGRDLAHEYQIELARLQAGDGSATAAVAAAAKRLDEAQVELEVATTPGADVLQRRLWMARSRADALRRDAGRAVD